MSERPSTEEVVHALRELDRAAVPVEEPGRAGYRRERVVRAIGRQLATEQARPRSVRRWLAVACAAVLVLGVGGTTWTLSGRGAPVESAKAAAGEVRSIVGEVSVRRSGAPARALAVGEIFQGGEWLRTAGASSLEIGIESGRARLEAESALEIVRPSASERRLRLGKGAVDVDLPAKLQRGEHLVIETPDADVVVVGTAFSVDLRPEGDRSETVVSVRRGTVWVQRGGRQAAVLHAGESWRSGERVTARANTETETPPPGRALESEIKVVPRAVARNGAPAARARESGTLGEENRLFEGALSARNAGDFGAAADGFRLLLSRYPRSILAEQALAGQFRSLERAGRSSAAVVAARRYLVSYPQGFARADAERLTSASLGDR
ncbi:MAG TPA: FecR domain-containing protein [Polyangiaceae bacterium]